MDIDKAFEEFMEFPEGSDKKTVTSLSCKLFAKWVAEQLQERIDELSVQVKKIVEKMQDGDALTTAYLYGFSDARKRIKELEQRVIDLQNHDDLSYIDKKLKEQESAWTGLTDDEVEEVMVKRTAESFTFPFHYRSFYKAVEAKLKEKNGG